MGIFLFYLTKRTIILKNFVLKFFISKQENPYIQTATVIADFNFSNILSNQTWQVTSEATADYINAIFAELLLKANLIIEQTTQHNNVHIKSA